MSQAGSSIICLTNESLVSHGDEMIQSANDEVNIAKDLGCYLYFSAIGVAYWNVRGPSDCQHHNEPFNKSYWHFSSGQPIRYVVITLLAKVREINSEYVVSRNTGNT